MLKLEKVDKSHQISIVLRDRETFWTRPLVIAFSYAASFHLLLLVIFQITPLKLNFNESQFSPIVVEMDTFPNDSLVLAEMAITSPIASGLPPFTSSTPSIPDHPYYSSLHHSEDFKDSSIRGNPFDRLEKDLYQPKFMPLVHSSPLPIAIIISGELANYPLMIDGWKNKKLPPLSVSEEKGWRAIYHVRMETKTGNIFWYESKKQTHVASLDRLSESILQEIRFSKEIEGFVVTGEIELHYTNERPKR